MRTSAGSIRARPMRSSVTRHARRRAKRRTPTTFFSAAAARKLPMRALILRSLRYPGWSSLRRGQTLLYNSLCSPSRHLPAVSPLVSRRFLQVRAPLRTGQTTAARTTPAPEQTQWTLTVEELVERVRNAIWEGKSGSMWAFFPFFPLLRFSPRRLCFLEEIG